MSAQLDIETASPTSPRSPTSLIGHAADENSEDTNRGLISGHLRTGLGFTKKALGLGITLLLVGAVVLLALNYSATTEISEGNVLSSSKDHKPLKTASLHYIVNRLDKYTESHDLKELFGTLEDVTVTSPSGRMDKVKATESHLSADGNKLTLTAAGGSKAVIKKLTNGKVVVSIEDPNDKAWTPPKTKPGARRSGRATKAERKACRKTRGYKSCGDDACRQRKLKYCLAWSKTVRWAAAINGMKTGLTDNAMSDASSFITAILDKIAQEGDVKKGFAAVGLTDDGADPSHFNVGSIENYLNSKNNNNNFDEAGAKQVARAMEKFFTDLLGAAAVISTDGKIKPGDIQDAVCYTPGAYFAKTQSGWTSAGGLTGQ